MSLSLTRPDGLSPGSALAGRAVTYPAPRFPLPASSVEAVATVFETPAHYFFEEKFYSFGKLCKVRNLKANMVSKKYTMKKFNVSKRMLRFILESWSKVTSHQYVLILKSHVHRIHFNKETS